MATAATTQAEIAFALTFLKSAGVTKAHTRIYLILAVIAWRRDGLRFNKELWKSPYNVLKRLKGTAGGSSVLKTLRQYVAASNYEQQQQAVRFMTVLGLSAWDKDHFGIFDKPPLPDGSIDTSGNRLFAIWNKLLALKHNIPQPQQPGQEAAQPPKPKPTIRRRQADDKVYLTPVPVYIQPYAAFDFYEDRRKTPGQAGELVG